MSNPLEKLLGWKNPAKEAMKYQERIVPEANAPLQNYVQNAQNPGQTQNQFAQGFQQSPQYTYELSKALEAAEQAANAGGMGGSLQHQYDAMEAAQGIAHRGFQDYQQNNLGIYNAGLPAAQLQSSNISHGLAQQANTAYNNRQYQNMFNAGSILGPLGAVAATAFSAPNNNQGNGQGGNQNNNDMSKYITQALQMMMMGG
jgi:hypothetical protein